MCLSNLEVVQIWCHNRIWWIPIYIYIGSTTACIKVYIHFVSMFSTTHSILDFLYNFLLQTDTALMNRWATHLSFVASRCTLFSSDWCHNCLHKKFKFVHFVNMFRTTLWNLVSFFFFWSPMFLLEEHLQR